MDIYEAEKYLSSMGIYDPETIWNSREEEFELTHLLEHYFEERLTTYFKQKARQFEKGDIS